MNFAEYICGSGFRRVADCEVRVAERTDEILSLCDPGRVTVDVADGASVRMVVAHGAGSQSEVTVRLGAGAQAEVVEWFEGGCSVVRVQQARESRFAMTAVVTGSAQAEYRTELDGTDAEYRFGGVFLAGAGDESSVRMRVAHNVAGCRSESTVKGVASANGRGRFEGLVYVAKDAQQTDARQTSRNLLIGGEARITTLPQLEIYADDVKCSHGATVGQMDADAVLYMRQRGISEALARRLQVGGFIADVAMHCAVAEVGDALIEALQERTELM